jgi:hypothetical protein
MNCYEAIDLMGDELEGRLPTASREGFQEHLAESAACHTYLDQLRVTISALEHMPRVGVTPQRRVELIEAFRRERRKSD